MSCSVTFQSFKRNCSEQNNGPQYSEFMLHWNIYFQFPHSLFTTD